MNTEQLHPVLRQMPANWRIARIDDLFAIQQGKQVSARHREGDRQRPFLRTKNVYWGRLDLTDLDAMHFSEEDELRLRLFPGDLLTCEGGWVGRTAIWNGEVSGCLHQNHLHRLRRISTNTDPWFALYWLWYAFDIGEVYFGRHNVTTIPNLSKSRLGQLPMPSPSSQEQRQIAAALSAVQRAIERQERLIALAAELKRALLERLFTQGVRGEARKRTDVGLVPESWDIVRFGDVAEFKNGINFTKDQKGGSGTPTIDVLNMYGEGSEVSLATLYRVDKRIPDDCFLHPGDLLFVRSSVKLEGVGWASMFGGASECVTFCGFIIRARLNGSRALDPKFLTYYFRTQGVRQRLVASGVKVAITNINQGLLSGLPVPCPTPDEQALITTTLTAVDRLSGVHNQRLISLNRLFRTLLHQLMTAEIRVKDLDVSALEDVQRTQVA